MPDVVFGDGNLAEAAALFDQLPTSKPAGLDRGAADPGEARSVPSPCTRADR
jgi:hypothetical protein